YARQAPRPALGALDQEIDWNKYTDLDMIHRDGTMLAAVRVADLWNSPARADLQKALPETMFSEGSLKANWGLAPQEIERLTVFSPYVDPVNLANPGNLLILIRTTKPYDRSKLSMTLLGKEALEGAKMQAYPLGGNSNLQVAFLNKQTILFGPEEDV